MPKCRYLIVQSAHSFGEPPWARKSSNAVRRNVYRWAQASRIYSDQHLVSIIFGEATYLKIIGIRRAQYTALQVRRLEHQMPRAISQDLSPTCRQRIGSDATLG